MGTAYGLPRNRGVTMSLYNNKTAHGDERRTPDYFFKYLNRWCGPFDVDLAATYRNTKCEYYYDKSVNALSVSWHKEFPKGAGFLNPPFSNIDPWIDKAIEEATKGFVTTMIMEIPNGEIRQEKIFNFATHFTWITGRIPYCTPDGVQEAGHKRGSCFIEFSASRPCRFGHVRHSLIKEYK